MDEKMTMRLLILLVLFQGCYFTSSPSHLDGLSFIEVRSADGWELLVFEDGSACLCCRIQGLTEVCIPQGTLSFSNIQNELSCCRVSGVGAYRVNIQMVGESESFHLSASDSTKVTRWFNQTYTQAKKNERSNKNAAFRKIQKLWIKHTPPGITDI